jgi:uncharacterized membrane protein YagU involved in acid resistance
MLIGVIMGVDPNTISIARGMAFGFNNDNNNALIVGLVVHLLTSTVIGIIFAILVTKVSRFEITGYKKGLIEGIILGIAVFAIQTQTQILGENMLVTGLGFLAHIVYGVVLGSMTTFLLRRRGSS